VGFGLYGDTPDTRSTNAEVARYFVEHRGSVLAGVVVSALGLMVMLSVVARIADDLSVADERRTGFTCQLTGTVAVVAFLLAIDLPLAALSYVVGASAPVAAKALFEVTIVAAPICAIALAALTWHVGTGLRRTGVGRRWYATMSSAFAVGLLVVGCGYAYRGPLSPDVGQQIVALALVIWLAGSDPGLRPRQLSSG
jgi:hypothetical protein